MHALLVDRNSGLVLDTGAEWMIPNSVSGTMTLTGVIDLPPGEYNFVIEIYQDAWATGYLAGAHLQVIVGQVVETQHCPGQVPE